LTLQAKLTTHISLHEGQLEFITSGARVTAVTAGQGGGKTSGAYEWLHPRMKLHPGFSWFVGFPTYKLLDRVVINPVDPERLTLMQFLEEMGEEPVLHKIASWIECVSGNILFASAENLKPWDGSHVAGFWIDEFDECPLAAFKRSMERTRYYAGQRDRYGLTMGQVLLTGTPRNVKWIKQELGTPEKPSPNYDVKFVRFKSTANPNYSETSMEEARRTLPAWEFKRLYEGELAEKAGGNLFHREWWQEYQMVFEEGHWTAQIDTDVDGV